MIKNARVFLSGMLMLALLITGIAHAELSRGSSGEEVASLQMMLFDMGYLFEAPDGNYGARTEAAVKDYQCSAGLEETGVVTDELMGRISQDWADYQNWIYEQLELDAGDNHAPFCYTWEDENGLMIAEYCREHALLWSATEDMLSSGDADSALYSYYEWQAEIISQYNELIELAGEPAQAQLETSKELCIQLMEAQLDAMFASYDACGTEIDPADVYYGAEVWMRTHSAWLCQLFSTLNAE